ncbi:MAG TPA: protein kinase [Actinomycetes bacterium]
MITVLLNDRYELDRPISGGGMGAVWRAVDRRLDRPVAVKLLRRDLAADPAFVERFRREARAAGALSHPNVAGVFDYGEHDGQAFIVMELVEGENLAERLARGGPLPWPLALAIAEQVARALAAAHAHGLVHRDVKPANILLARQPQFGASLPATSEPDIGKRQVGRLRHHAAPATLAEGMGSAAAVQGDGLDPPLVKVTDFGIARSDHSATLTGTGALLGSAGYVAPEQASGARVGPAADLYGLGCVLFEMVTGAAPYRGETAVALATQHVSAPVPNPRERRPELPGAVAAIILKALQKDPAERFGSAAAMADALADARHVATARTPGEATEVLPVIAAGAAVPGRVARLAASGAAAAPGSAPTIRTRPVGPPPRVRYRRSGAGTWAKVAAALAVAALALLTWLTVRDANQAAPPRQGAAGRPAATATPPPARVRVPDLRGLSDQAARAALQRLGLRVAAPERHGTVIGTRPRPGSLVRRGSTVRLLLAGGNGKHQGDHKGQGKGGDGQGNDRGGGES